MSSKGKLKGFCWSTTKPYERDKQTIDTLLPSLSNEKFQLIAIGLKFSNAFALYLSSYVLQRFPSLSWWTNNEDDSIFMKKSSMKRAHKASQFRKRISFRSVSGKIYLFLEIHLKSQPFFNLKLISLFQYLLFSLFLYLNHLYNFSLKASNKNNTSGTTISSPPDGMSLGDSWPSTIFRVQPLFSTLHTCSVQFEQFRETGSGK